jgi:hypothetical protein
MSRLTRMLKATLDRLAFVSKQPAPTFTKKVAQAHMVHDLQRTAKRLKRARSAARAERDARERY